uniref:Odorant receptor n=1 Tax=Phlebotomus papatasi TaxID=29031 RepID=A0A3F2ZEB7_PHLPP
MTDYIESYAEYLRFEKFVRRVVGILSPSFLPRKLFGGREKFSVLIFEIYFFISTVFTMIYLARKLTTFVLSVMIVAGTIQLITKTILVLSNTNELNILFLFIQQMYKINEIEMINISTSYHLKRILRITKLLLIILIPVCFLAGAGMISYFVYIDSLLIAVPGVFPSANSSLLYQHVHQILILQTSTLIIVISDMTLIIIGFYFIAILNIFRDTIRLLDNSELGNKRQFLINTHKFHCNILEKFKLFSRVFYYTFTVQIGSSVVFILIIVFLLRYEGSFGFYPLCVAIFAQFGAICIFGEFIFSKTDGLLIELYLTKWYEFNLSEQRIILMMMLMSQRPFGLKAAGMYNINLIMFIQVIKAAMSFCAILYTFT